MTAGLLAVLLLIVGPALAGADAPSLPSEAEPIDRQPYKIELHLVADPSARIDAPFASTSLMSSMSLARRFIGPAWSISVASRPSPLVGDGLARLKADEFSGFDPTLDKVWLVWAAADDQGAGLVFSGREYDLATRWLGPLQDQQAPSLRDLPRALFALARNLFSPSALITGQEGGRALLKVRGSALTPASGLGSVVAKGTTFIPIRLISMRDDSVRITRIAYTYLVAESIEGSTARCAIVSAFRDPLTRRMSRPNTLAALGIKPGDAPLHLRFVTKTDKTPAAGYTLTERTVPDGTPRDVGMTDRSGRITIPPGSFRALVKLRLLAGNSEPLAEFPMMPGESSEEREITVDPLPLAAKYQVRLDALRDEVVDQVALRGRLERMMQSRLDGEDWDGLEVLLKEYVALPRPATFSDALAKMKDEATQESYKTAKSTVLTKNLQAQFGELQAIIDGYLDDEAYSRVFRSPQQEEERRRRRRQKARALRSGGDTRPHAAGSIRGETGSGGTRPQSPTPPDVRRAVLTCCTRRRLLVM